MEKFEPNKKVEASKPQAGEKQGSKIKGFDVVSQDKSAENVSVSVKPGSDSASADPKVLKSTEIKSRGHDLTESALTKQQADFMTKFELAVKSAASDGGSALETLYKANESEIKAVQQRIAQLGSSLETALTKI